MTDLAGLTPSQLKALVVQTVYLGSFLCCWVKVSNVIGGATCTYSGLKNARTLDSILLLLRSIAMSQKARKPVPETAIHASHDMTTSMFMIASCYLDTQ